MFRFQTLNVWKKAVNYCDKILDIADKLPQKYQFSIGEQLRKAALSIPTNIAEGSGRRGKKENSQFYNISKGSVYETVNILIVSIKRKLLSKEEFTQRYKEAEEICKMLSGLVR